MPSPFSNSNNARWISIYRHSWKTIGILGGTILLPLIINILSTFLTSSRGIIPVDSPVDILIVQWPLTLSIGICLLLFALLMREVGRRSLQPQSSLNRRQMIRSLKRNYGNVFQAHLQKIDLIELDLIWQPDAVQSPTGTHLSMGYPRLNTQPLQLTKSSSILQCYDEAEGNLLILGKSGAGKSILLLQLAQLLTERAETNDAFPMPIIFYLSSWPTSNKSLEDWMCEQSSICWGIPQELFRQWISEKQIVFLLDELDETREFMKRCIRDINEYHEHHSGHSFVICSKWVEYRSVTVQEKSTAVQEQLHLQNAIVVQPLTQAQINKALSKESLAKELIPFAQTQDLSIFKAPSLENVLQDISQKEPEFGELVNTPLLLSFFILTCRSNSVGRQSSSLPKEIVNNFVQQMIENRGDKERYPLEQTQKWLGWQANKMHNNSLFYLENLQPAWLPKGCVSQIYEWIAGKSASMLIGLLMSFSFNAFLFGSEGIAKKVLFAVTGILLGTLIYSGKKEQFSLISMKIPQQRWIPLFGWSSLYGLIAGISIGSAFVLWPPKGYHGGFIVGESMALCFFFLSFFIRAGKTTQSTSPEHFWWPFPGLREEHAELGLLISMVMGIGMGVSMGISVGISAGLSYLIIGSLLGLFLLGEDNSIKLKDITKFSFNLFKKEHLLGTLFLFLLVAPWYGLSIVIESGFAKGVTYGLGAALAISVVYWISFGLWGGISQRVLDDYERREPNQGIRDSLRNALKISGIGFLIGTLSSIVDNVLFYILRDGFSANFGTELPAKLMSGSNAIVRDVISFVVLGTCIPFLLTGGLAWLRHYLLRLLLYSTGRTPLHYKHFLDDACKRALLIRVNGAYQFRHNRVSTYFKEYIRS
jgi:Cdc6-like AAA superfamily ATPase